jgi:quercetin dioxygenase-like cupin family protein
MRLYSFSRDVGRSVAQFGSQGVVFAPILFEQKQAYAGCMYLEPHGTIGRHESAMDQILLVVQGAAFVTGGDGEQVAVTAGCAVSWQGGEMHETRATAEGLMAVVIEGERLDPGRSMPLWKPPVT